MNAPFPILAVLFLATLLQGASRLPDWAQAAADLGYPTYDKDIGVVMLLDESSKEISERGRIRTRYRGVMKILQQHGRASAGFFYNEGEDKVRSFEAWMLQPDGSVERYRKRDVIDMEAASYGSLYSSGRRQRLSAGGDAKAGSVFAWEYVIDERTLFAEHIWWLRVGPPVIQSRLRLTLPADWEARVVPINGAEFAETRQGRTWTWQASDIDPILDETWDPAHGFLTTGIGITIDPPADARNAYVLFPDWGAVARYAEDVSSGPSQPNDAVRAKAAELTAGCATDLEKFLALTQYTQGLHYVSIATNLGNGGGYTPNAASMILESGYGDCKDKVTLLRALFKCIGVESYHTVVLAGGDRRVDPAWPSPSQFNHAIIAFRPPAGFASPVIRETPLGPLMFYDPTSEHTIFGDLPESIQGTPALIGSRQTPDLIELPSLPAEFNRRSERITVEVAPTGGIAARIDSMRIGQEAISMRSIYREQTKTQLRESFVRMLQDIVPGAELGEFTYRDNLETGALSTEVNFTHASYGRSMRDRFIILKPVIWGRQEWIPSEEEIEERTNPIGITAYQREQSTTLILPEGFVLDEHGENRALAEDFGEYSLRYEVGEGTLSVHRQITLRQTTLPRNEFAHVRAFFEQVLEGDNEPIVLMRKR